MIITYKMIINTGSKPPWYMGLAYHKIDQPASVFYIIPLHLIVNILWKLNLKWCGWKHKEPWIDKEIKRRMGCYYDELERLRRIVEHCKDKGVLFHIEEKELKNENTTN